GVVIALAVPDSTTLAVAAEAATLVLAQLITTPFLAAVVALLYIDARVRSEGLDLALMRAVEE
ncbi:MAG: hypothetical protein LBG60_10275, partial [Bifidobacteriaceae bacterium]|nr:hypothetical protein [Bifidobacteriaceae bacterium]